MQDFVDAEPSLKKENKVIKSFTLSPQSLQIIDFISGQLKTSQSESLDFIVQKFQQSISAIHAAQEEKILAMERKAALARQQESIEVFMQKEREEKEKKKQLRKEQEMQKIEEEKIKSAERQRRYQENLYKTFLAKGD